MVRDALDPGAAEKESYKLHTNKILEERAQTFEGQLEEAREKRVELAWKAYRDTKPSGQELMHLLVRLAEGHGSEDELELGDGQFTEHSVYLRLAYHVAHAIIRKATTESDTRILQFALGLLEGRDLTEEEFLARATILRRLQP